MVELLKIADNLYGYIKIMKKFKKQIFLHLHIEDVKECAKKQNFSHKNPKLCYNRKATSKQYFNIALYFL